MYQLLYTAPDGATIEVLRSRTFITPAGEVDYHRCRLVGTGDKSPGVIDGDQVFDLTTAELERNFATPKVVNV